MNIEHMIVTGLITSTEYIQQISHAWDINLLESSVAKKVASWCMEYYDKYNKAPGKNIQTIYFAKAKDLSEDIAEAIEEDYLPMLSEEHAEDSINLNYLLDKTYEFFKLRHLENHSEAIQGMILEGALLDAEKAAIDYKPISDNSGADLDLKSEAALTRINKAFDTTGENIIYYAGALGEFWNHQLRRGGFVALLSIEKMGKTFRLMEMAVRASKQKRKVAFFQAGDMTEDEQMIRLCVYLAGRSNIEKNCQKMWHPIKDCIRNQLNTCDKPERECHFGVFEEWTEKELRKELTMDLIVEARKNNRGYKACHNCQDYRNKSGYGSVWMRLLDRTKPLTVKQAEKIFEAFFTGKRSFKLSSHTNGSLTVKQIRIQLDIWEKTEGFVPDVVVIDYADLLVPEERMDFRQQQNEIWKALRGLSQERHCLLLTATQADAKSYDKDRLTLANFSEDKRKNAHVTAMYGLNQDKNGREKALGIMRINEIVIREGTLSGARDVTVLQNLNKGKPFLGSYWT